MRVPEGVRILGNCLKSAVCGVVDLEVDLVGVEDDDDSNWSCPAVDVVVLTGLEAEGAMGAKALNGRCCVVGVPFAVAAAMFIVVVDCRGFLGVDVGGEGLPDLAEVAEMGTASVGLVFAEALLIVVFGCSDTPPATAGLLVVRFNAAVPFADNPYTLAGTIVFVTVFVSVLLVVAVIWLADFFLLSLWLLWVTIVGSSIEPGVVR